MKRKFVLSIILCFVAVVLFGAIEAFRAAKFIAQDKYEHQNIQKISFTLINYAEIHGKYPTALDDLARDPDTNSQNAMQMFHDQFEPHYDYIPGTNGFTLTVSARNQWFGQGSRYHVEYETSKDHDVLKINGKTSLESWIKE